ncbi:MAG: hydrogenase expression/formation protein HypE [Candidatus Bathyarchaeia archaeon]
MRSLEDRVRLVHGAGGLFMQEFIDRFILSFFKGGSFEVPLEALDDSAVVEGVVFTSDSHTVKPLFFPGGDIGSLAVAGTVNDLAVLGARPVALSCALLIEEGFPFSDLERILSSMRDTCRMAGVHIATGDTKVLEKGALEGLIVNTSGIGFRSPFLDGNLRVVEESRGVRVGGRWLLDSNLRPGDKLIVSGTIGDHGMALMAYREGYGFGAKLESDIKPLNKVVEELLKIGGIVAMKDPTRGGLAAALNEWSRKSGVGLELEEASIPVKEDVRAACEMLGIDPLEVGNEGKLLIAVVPGKAEEILEELRSTPEGRDAALIGEAVNTFEGVVLRTEVGGRRLVPPPIGDPIPRIC